MKNTGHFTTTIFASIAFILLLPIFSFGQAPQGMNYQAVARDNSGAILANSQVDIRFSITDGDEGAVLYQETHLTTTNQFGLFTLSIGNGTPVSGNFSSIPWESINAWLLVEMDAGIGIDYVKMGSSPLLSVPYALYAASGNEGPKGDQGPSGPQGDPGPAGMDGANGATWFTGNGLPPNDLGTTGDLFLNSDTGDFYIKIEHLTWDLRGNLRGPQGFLPDGTAAGNTPYWDGVAWVTNSSNLFNAGNDIGINTSSPEGKLHIKGSEDKPQLIIDADTSQSNTNPLIKLRDSNGMDLMWISSDDTTNTFVGMNTGRVNQQSDFAGNHNTFIGSDVGYANTSGRQNTASGADAFRRNTEGYQNTAYGFSSQFNNLTGYANSALGVFSLFSNETGYDNTAFGAYSLYNSTSSSNTAVGTFSLYSNTTGMANTAIGPYTLYNNTSGEQNIAIGITSLNANTLGSFNTAIGTLALTANTEGSQNVAVGSNALAGNKDGNNNTAIGTYALLSNTTGNSNIAIGTSALSKNTTGGTNTATGRFAMFENTTGNFNTASGHQAMYSNTDGFSNTAVGHNALYANTSGSLNTAIGEGAFFPSGTLNNTTAIGFDAGGVVNASNRIEIGNASIMVIAGQVGFSTYSDARIKDNISEDVPGIAFINKLRPVTYNLNIHKQNEMVYNSTGKDQAEWPEKYDIEKIKMTGFLAQDVENAAREVAYDFSGIQRPSEPNELYSLRYSEFVVPLVKAVQEQQEMIQDQNKIIEELLIRIEKLEETIKSR